MTTGAKVGIFVAGLCVVFGAAAAIGNAVGPVDSRAGGDGARRTTR